MKEKINYQAASVFVANNDARRRHQSSTINAGVTHYSGNIVYKGTPKNNDFISIENRRKYVYNGKK